MQECNKEFKKTGLEIVVSDSNDRESHYLDRQLVPKDHSRSATGSNQMLEEERCFLRKRCYQME